MITDIQSLRQEDNWRDFVALYYFEPDFANKVDADPTTAFRRAGIHVPEGKKIELLKDNHEVIHFVLPPVPSGELEKFAARYHGDQEFAMRVNNDPAAALREAGLDVPEGKAVRLSIDTDKVMHFVLPPADDAFKPRAKNCADKEQILGLSRGIINRANDKFNLRVGRLFLEEKFRVRLENDHGCFEIMLIASADRSGKLKLEAKSLPESIELYEKLLFICKGSVKLSGESLESGRRLTSYNVKVRTEDSEDSDGETIQLLFEPSRVTITDTANEPRNELVRIGAFLSEFEYHEHFDKKKIRWGHELDSFSLLDTWSNTDNNIKCRSSNDKRVTASINLYRNVERAPNPRKCLPEATELMQRLLSVFNFAHGGRLFCPITEVELNGCIETTFFCNDESKPQFMPVIARGQDFKALIASVVNKIRTGKSNKRWKSIKDAIRFFLDSQQINEISLFSNLAAIEKLLKSLNCWREGDNFSGKVMHHLQNEQLGGNGLIDKDIIYMKKIRNDLAHECVFKGDIRELARYISISREIFTRILLNFLDFDGYYVSFLDDSGQIGGTGARKFKEGLAVNDIRHFGTNGLNFMKYLNEWEQKVDDSITRASSIFLWNGN